MRQPLWLPKRPRSCVPGCSLQAPCNTQGRSLLFQKRDFPPRIASRPNQIPEFLTPKQVHIGTFSATALTFVQLPTSAGTDQYPNQISSRPYPHKYWASPAPRRDSSIAIMGNTGSENGRLLVFGGFAAVSTSQMSAVFDYLEAQDHGVYAFNDLWYLDLSTLTVECARSAVCGTILNWYQVDVPGEKRPLCGANPWKTKKNPEWCSKP